MEGIDKSEIRAWIVELGSFPKKVLAIVDNSESYEMDRRLLIRLENGSYAVVKESGCSCYSSEEAQIEVFRTLREAKKVFEGTDAGESPTKWSLARKAREEKER